jgi:hypothetical protein
MTRRRLILAIVAAVLVGMAWWLSLDRLSAQERLLVGTWLFGGKAARATASRPEPSGAPRLEFVAISEHSERR